MLLVNFMLHDQGLNVVKYCSRLNEAIYQKKLWCLHNSVILLHDNTTQHIINLTKYCFQQHNWNVLLYSLYIPDLNPLNYHLFGPLKQHLSCKQFRRNYTVIAEAQMCLQFFEDIPKTMHQHDICIMLNKNVELVMFGPYFADIHHNSSTLIILKKSRSSWE